MIAINYSAKVLPDGHLSLPDEIKKKMGLAVNNTVKVILEIDIRNEKAIKAFGVWSARNDIKAGVDYVSKLRGGWNERTETIDNV
jgi:hypothetical protein